MRQRSDGRDSSGFTLLEVLIALALLGLLAGALYGTYFSLVKGRESAEQGMEARRELRSTLDQLRRELNATLYRRSDKRLRFIVEDRDIFGKPASTLTFNAITGPQPGSAILSDQGDFTYAIVERDRSMILSRKAKDRYHTAEAARYPQMESLQGFLVECQSGDKWVRSWDTAINPGLPKAVRVTITVAEGERITGYSILAYPRISQ